MLCRRATACCQLLENRLVLNTTLQGRFAEDAARQVASSTERADQLGDGAVFQRQHDRIPTALG